MGDGMVARDDPEGRSEDLRVMLAASLGTFLQGFKCSLEDKETQVAFFFF